MERNLASKCKYVWDRLWTEIKKDWLFFGGCGFFVGLCFIWRGGLKAIGIAQGNNWAADLFSDFMSITAFSLVLLGLIVLESINALFKKPDQQRPRLEASIAHVESRLVQITSSVFSFTLGLCALTLLHSMLCMTTHGVKLAIKLFLNFGGILPFQYAAALVFLRSGLLDTRWGASITLLLAIVATGWILVKGTK